jgi:hypothetical protein
MPVACFLIIIKEGFMKTISLFVMVLPVLGITGCGSMPRTAEEFRQAVPGAFMAGVETFEVERPFKDVAATFQKMAPKCLDTRIQTTSQTSTSYQVIVTKYNPTVIVSKNRAELHVQQIHEKGVVAVYEMPPKGYYLMVVDAIPVNSRKTKIDMYRPSMGHDVMVNAIKGWATGKNVGCPDLTK